MKRVIFSIVIALLLVFAISASISAAGAPASHELSGHEFGQAVSELARSEPGAVADHVLAIHEEEQLIEEPLEEEPPVEEPPEEVHGMPALHGMTGREFGQAVSELARSEPGAVAVHVHAIHEVEPPEEELMEEEPIGEELLEEEPSEELHGMPALHALAGHEFGQAVRELARSAPGAVAAHVK